MAPRKTKRSDGRYSSTLRYVDPVTGAKKRAYFYGKTQAESKAKAEKARQRLAHGAPVRDASRTLVDWLGEWQVTFLERATEPGPRRSCTRATARRGSSPPSGMSVWIGSRPLT
jgi:hypothetical protein